MIKDVLVSLGDLYSLTGEDWDLRIHHCLTEPTCPTAVIQPEGWEITRYRSDADSIEEAVKYAASAVIKEIIDREPVGSLAPFTNPDDAAFLEWLKRRWAGSDEQLPERPGTKPHD